MQVTAYPPYFLLQDNSGIWVRDPLPIKISGFIGS